MILCKNLEITNKIENLDEWYEKCPPQEKSKHWKDGRSAKETAKLWLKGIPIEFSNQLKPFNLDYKICSPEYLSKFDTYDGNGRNHDLLIIAENNSGEKVVVSVESKVDEPFSKTIRETIIKAKKELEKNPRSNWLKRIEELRNVLFGSVSDEQLPIRYQLLYAIAGTLADAKRNKAKTAVFIIQTLITQEINNSIYLSNQKDLDEFLRLLTNGKHASLKDGELVGPFRIPESTDLIPNDVDLWIGKYEIKI